MLHLLILLIVIIIVLVIYLFFKNSRKPITDKNSKNSKKLVLHLNTKCPFCKQIEKSGLIQNMKNNYPEIPFFVYRNNEKKRSDDFCGGVPCLVLKKDGKTMGYNGNLWNYKAFAKFYYSI